MSSRTTQVNTRLQTTATFNTTKFESFCVQAQCW